MFNKKTTRFVAIITLLILPFCSPIVIADEQPLDINLDNMLQITGVSDLMAKFSRFVYSMKGDEGEITQIIYEYLGRETIDGAEVDKASLRASSPREEQEMLFWVDSEGKMIKVLDNQSGQEIPIFFAGMATMFFFLPFYMAEGFDLEEMYRDGPEDLVVLTDVSDRNIGGMPAKVFSYNISGYDDQGNEFISIYEIGDFGDFQIMVGFDMEMDGEEHTWGFWVEEIVLH